MVARQAALVEWLGAVVTHRPCVVAVDDLQWVDKPSLDLLDVALRELRQRPLLVVAAARPDLDRLYPQLWSRRTPLRQRLAPMSRLAGQALLAWAAAGAPGDLEAFAFDRWEGNPFYLTEIVEDRKRPRTTPRDAAPDTVLGAIEPRIVALGDECRRVLRAASLFGDSFEFEAVLSMLGLKGRPALEETLATLVEADLIRRVDEPRGLYAFRGRLVREAAFAMLSPTDKSLGVARARQWLEEAGKTLPELLLEGGRRGGRSTSTKRSGVEVQV
jgi:predicted ATPase